LNFYRTRSKSLHYPHNYYHQDSNPNSTDIKIKEFLNEAKNVNIKDYFFDVSYKKGLLIKYFPNRFGPKGTQNLDNYKDGQIGSIFERVVINYLKKV